MKPSKLINELVEYISEYGDEKDVLIDLLTENQSNIVKPTGTYINSKGEFQIEIDIENKREFKKNIK